MFLPTSNKTKYFYGVVKWVFENKTADQIIMQLQKVYFLKTNIRQLPAIELTWKVHTDNGNTQHQRVNTS